MKLDIAKEVYKDAVAHSDLPASVAVFLTKWAPFMFRKLKNQEQEIDCLRFMLDKRKDG